MFFRNKHITRLARLQDW